MTRFSPWIFLGLVLTISNFLGCSSKLLNPPNHLREFTTDGCSLAPNGTPSRSQSLLRCCVEHDYVYWHGGSSHERLKADQSLKDCVSKAESSAVGRLYYDAVRVGGSSIFKTNFYWGYGWTQKRTDAPLTTLETQQVLEQSQKIDWNKIYQSF
jgi:hypothetical protein